MSEKRLNEFLKRKIKRLHSEGLTEPMPIQQKYNTFDSKLDEPVNENTLNRLKIKCLQSRMEEVNKIQTHDPRECSKCLAANEVLEQVEFIRRKMAYCVNKVTELQLEQTLLNYQDPLWIASQVELSARPKQHYL